MAKPFLKSRNNILLGMLSISVLLKLIVYFTEMQYSTFERISIFANIFILMSGVFFAIRLHKAEAEKATAYLDDFKSGMRIAALYALCMALFVYLYYEFLDPEYFANRLDQQLELARENQLDVEKARKMGEFVLSPYFQSTITLIGYLLLGSFYSGIIAFLVRKFSGFRH